MLIDVTKDHGLEQLVHFPTREKNTLDLILTYLPGQFHEIHSPNKLNYPDVISGTLKIYTLSLSLSLCLFPPPQKKKKERKTRNLGGRCIFTKREILSH